MKSFEIQEFGIEKLALVQGERPRPGAGEVLVRMTAASLNYRDYMVVKGVYNPRKPRPMVPLSDGAGIVDRLVVDLTPPAKR
jgi:NADPH:quinone reductase-like Zn-dependent oxidoreductase